MGKKSKMINEDPILKKNFKYQKRKKENQLEKQILKQQQLHEQNRINELKIIQKQVQADIERLYQNQKNQLLNLSAKTKTISKNQSFITAFKGHKNTLQLQPESNKNIDQQFTKNLSSYSVHFIKNAYKHHFQSPIPKETSELFMKEKKITQTMRLEQQIKDDIKSMFSVHKVGEEQNSNKKFLNRKFMQDESMTIKKQRDLQAALQEQQKQQEPYVIDKKGKLQSQIVIEGKVYSVSRLGLQNSRFLQGNCQKTQEQPHNLAEGVSAEYQLPLKIVTNYMDYVHVQNNQEQTIEEFRKIVISHMYQHQISCINSLKEGSKAKGFTNSKYLIITPYVGDAKAIFDLIEQYFMKDEQTKTQITQSSSQIQSKKNKKNKTPQWLIQNKEKIQQNQNDEEDFFRVGIKILAKKKKIVYFSNFDASDIVVASPIGLKSIINGQSGKKQNSFLSSVEIVYVDRASVIMMQNWDHLLDIFNNLNYMVKYESLKNSINEIRSQLLELKGRVYRQNIIFTEFSFPELNSLKINYFNNWQGCLTSKPIYRPLILENNSKIQKNFYKIELKQPKDDLEMRFNYFKRKFWDKIHNSDQMNKIVLFVNSYFEFVKLKSFLQKVNASFEAISEHTRKQKIQSRISRFNNKSYRILLLTERAYYFELCQIKKQKHLYFYSLPKNAFIYKDLIQNMEQEDQTKIICIYSKYDKFIIQRLVGSMKSIEMIKQYCTNVSFII